MRNAEPVNGMATADKGGEADVTVVGTGPGANFVNRVGEPVIMGLSTTYGLPHKTWTTLVMKLQANLTDERDGDAMDRIINTVCKAAPAA